jgi:peroxiredoxin
MKNNSTTTVVIVIIIGSVICFFVGICAACGMLTLWNMPFDNSDNNSGPAEMDSSAAPQTGEFAPDFQLQSITGETVTLSEFRGQPVLVNFWATWCSPCVDEMPHIEERYRQYAPELVVLAIESDSSRNDLLDFIQEEEITFTVLVGTESVSRDYEIYAYPTSFFIDADGVIQAVFIGSMSMDVLDENLAKIGVGD